MSIVQAFKRQAVPPQMAQQLQTTTIPAPTRGIIQNENFTFMQPGAAIICDNWVPTLRGVKLRGGCERWAVLPEDDADHFRFRVSQRQRAEDVRRQRHQALRRHLWRNADAG